jgi:hypothetical protein
MVPLATLALVTIPTNVLSYGGAGATFAVSYTHLRAHET